MKTCLYLSFLLLITPFVHAADDLPLTKDFPSGADHPLIKRFEGSKIRFFAKKAFDEHTIALEQLIWDYDAGKFKPHKTVTTEGAKTTIVYVLPPDVSTLEVIRAYQAELTELGSVETLFQATNDGSKNELDDGYDRFVKQVYGMNSDNPATGFMQYNSNARYLASKVSRPEGDLYFTAYVAVMDDNSFDRTIPKGRLMVRVDVVQSKARKQRMVEVKSDEMSSEITKAGRIALYGLYFDTNKTDLKPESASTLTEIAKLLNSNTSLKLLVVGHTDNVGTFEANRDLSQRRAGAVVNELVSRYQSDPTRLFSFGVSFASPMAPNTTDDGRAKNRRVELVNY